MSSQTKTTDIKYLDPELDTKYPIQFRVSAGAVVFRKKGGVTEFLIVKEDKSDRAQRTAPSTASLIPRTASVIEK